MSRTRRQYASDAEECRDRGFKVGDRLVGNEGYGPTVIQLDYIGKTRILATEISHNGEPRPMATPEDTWTLSCRDWELVQPDARDEEHND
jgi:hypothetical protein